MNKGQAYRLGVASGYESGIYGELTAKQLTDKDAFVQAAAEICDNKRQLTGSRAYSFVHQPNSESRFNVFDQGEAVGILRAWRQRRKKKEALDLIRQEHPHPLNQSKGNQEYE